MGLVERLKRKEVIRKVRLCAEQGTWDLECMERPGDKGIW